MKGPTARPDVPLGPTSLALLAGVLAASRAGTGAFVLWLASAALVLPRVRGPALAVVTGVLIGTTPTDVPTPGVYALVGVVRHIGRPAFHRVLVTLEVERIGGQDRQTRARIRVPVWLARRWQVGSRLHAIVRLTGENERGHFQGALPDAQGVTGVDPPTDKPGPLQALRTVAAAAFDNALSEANAGLARAMVLGEREGITRVDRQCFRDTGQAHLLAVSGLHVGLWLMGLLVLLRLTGLGPRPQALCALAAVSLYVPLTGAPPSATRAGCAAGIHFGGRLLGRAPAPLVVLSVVALGVVIAKPRAAFDVAFQLSFGAVLGILVLTRPLTAILLRPRPVLPGFVEPIRAPVRRSLAVSLAAWMGTLPFVAAAMGQATPAAPAVAVVTVPLTAAVLLSSMALLALGWIPGLGGLLASGAEAAFDLLRWVLHVAQDLGVRPLPIGAPTALAALAYGLACAWLAAAQTRRAAVRALVVYAVLVSAWWIGTAVPSHAVHGYHPRDVYAHLSLAFAPYASPASLGLLAGALLVVSALSVRMHWLTASGAACAAALGMLGGWAFGAAGLAALFAPFLVATLLGKLPGKGRAGARTPRQVLSNGIPAALGCVLTLLGHPIAGSAVFLGGLSCLGSDSCATEIGVRYGGTPWSLTGASVRSGESGGVTLAGTAAALGGSLLAPVGWFAFSGGFAGAWAAVFSIAAAGFAGSLLDSVLGAALQYRGRVAGTDTIVEETCVDGTPTERVRGLQFLDNDAVNLVSGLAASALAVALWNLSLGGMTR